MARIEASCGTGRNRPGWLAGGFMLAAALVAGCGTSRSNRLADTVPADPPAFLVGPVCALLTNSAGFSANITVELPGVTNKNRLITGVLLGREGKLLFSPTKSETSYIWSVPENTGFVMNEALQGYAAVGGIYRVTGAAVNSPAPSAHVEKINGVACRETEAVIAMSSGTNAEFTLWRSADAKSLPVRIRSTRGTAPFTMTLAYTPLQAPRADLFLPPDGFVRYASIQAMNDELLVRSATLRKTPASLPDRSLMPANGRSPY